ncbi:glycosyltransferase family 2 protein [Lacticaseibacillus jixianensis]|uniref:Glycosyltransferase family 2 protein n=1 Tax=Lacticaseibacillus jixianensis TaxID=2486012 RepID=A0ABW4B863_9LACO|nr:glycosyltransferase family 2 protein [Lacticaseibacillus jixianensis]
MRSEIGVVILNYMQFELTKRCVESVLQSQDVLPRIVIVDNNSQDGSVENLSRAFHNDNRVTVLESGENLGYAYGNNIGLDYLCREGLNLFCILNNDVSVTNHTFMNLVRVYPHDKPAVIGPCLLEADQGDGSVEIQSIGASINLWKATSVLKFNGRQFDKQLRSRLPQLMEADYISGACIFFSFQTLRTVGKLPENYFLYFEETEWCVRAKRKGILVAATPNARVYHEGSKSVGKSSKLLTYYLNRNSFLFIRRNGSMPQRIFFPIYRLLRFAIKRERNSWYGILAGLRREEGVANG